MTRCVNSKYALQKIGLFVESFGRDPIVADEGVGEDENLGPVRRIGKRLGISNHASLEHWKIELPNSYSVIT